MKNDLKIKKEDTVIKSETRTIPNPKTALDQKVINAVNRLKDDSESKLDKAASEVKNNKDTLQNMLLTHRKISYSYDGRYRSPEPRDKLSPELRDKLETIFRGFGVRTVNPVIIFEKYLQFIKHPKFEETDFNLMAEFSSALHEKQSKYADPLLVLEKEGFFKEPFSYDEMKLTMKRIILNRETVEKDERIPSNDPIGPIRGAFC